MFDAIPNGFQCFSGFRHFYKGTRLKIAAPSSATFEKMEKGENRRRQPASIVGWRQRFASMRQAAKPRRERSQSVVQTAGGYSGFSSITFGAVLTTPPRSLRAGRARLDQTHSQPAIRH
jgi:hypothetical protein